MNVLGRSPNAHVGHLAANQVEGDYHFHAAQVRAEDQSEYFNQLDQLWDLD
jgi:hypothetical protein